MGWYNTITPAVIQRNVFENPVWYTSYTLSGWDFAREVEALMNFQTAVCDLQACRWPNSSLLDEATAARAVTMMHGLRPRDQQRTMPTWCWSTKDFSANAGGYANTGVASGHWVTGWSVHFFEFTPDVFACVIRYPNADGSVEDYRGWQPSTCSQLQGGCSSRHTEFGTTHSSGRMGCGCGFGSTYDWACPCSMADPRLLTCYARWIQTQRTGTNHWVVKDKYGKPCFRAWRCKRVSSTSSARRLLQTSAAQALLATMAGFYTVYHGEEGIKSIARKIHATTVFLIKHCRLWATTSSTRLILIRCA